LICICDVFLFYVCQSIVMVLFLLIRRWYCWGCEMMMMMDTGLWICGIGILGGGGVVGGERTRIEIRHSRT